MSCIWSPTSLLMEICRGYYVPSAQQRQPAVGQTIAKLASSCTLGSLLLLFILKQVCIERSFAEACAHYADTERLPMQ